MGEVKVQGHIDGQESIQSTSFGEFLQISISYETWLGWYTPKFCGDLMIDSYFIIGTS